MSEYICGIDEAGRGPWAGPVCAGIVLAKPAHIPTDTNDSKRLSPKKRESLAAQIKKNCIWNLGWASPGEIDRLNIRKATHLAMQRAFYPMKTMKNLPLILIDGNDPPDLSSPCRAIIRGDQSEPCIAAASILAKTARDRFMLMLDTLYPGYGFHKHKGYGVTAHKKTLQQLGPCPAHRFSFKPVRQTLTTS